MGQRSQIRARLRAAICACAAASLPALAPAATFTVTTTADDGPGSLRQAIRDANASAGSDTIAFALPSGETQIALSSALDDINGDLLLDGPAGELTIRGASNTTQIFRVISGETVVHDLTLEQGTLSMAAGARLTFDLAQDRTFERAISSDGELIKQGSAKLTLTGMNTWTGGTTVSAGTLQGSPSSLPGDISIAAGATLVFDESGFGFKDGEISGSGRLVKTGAGTLWLDGANPFAGQVSVEQGTLMGSEAALSGSSFSLAQGAKLNFREDGIATEAAAISGAGSLEKTGVGTLRLTGANTYSGGTTVGEGALVGSVQSIPGDVQIAGSAALVFDQPSDATRSGKISGAGFVVKIGAGTITFTGTNTYTGSTTISQGGLRGSTAALQGNITNYGVLIFDQPSDGSFAGVVSGTGTLEKTGAGALRITQSQTYTGGTRVGAGAIELVSANLASDVAVEVGAALRGSGAIGDLATAGRIAPRASSGFGTLQTADASFESGSRLDVRVAAGSGNDRLAASGNVAILPGAALDLEPLAGSYAAPVSFDILTGASVSGTFTELPQFAFLTLALDNPGDRITATLQASGASSVAFADTRNQREVATALEAVRPTASGDLETLFDNLVLLDEAEVPGALDTLSGEVIADFEHGRLVLTRRMRGVIDTRLAQLRSDVSSAPPRRRALPRSASRARDPLPAIGSPPRGARTGAWITGLGAVGDLEGESGASDLDYRLAGGSLGFDLELGRRGVAGVALGYSSADLELSGASGDGTDRALLGALYGAYTAPGFQLSGAAHFAHHELESRRVITIGSLSERARGESDGNDYGLSLGGSAEMSRIGAFRLDPVASLSWSRYERGSFTESGAGGISLDIDGETLDSLQGGLGLRAHSRFAVTESTYFSPEFFATWLHEFGDVERELRARFSGATVPAGFTIRGAELEHDSLLGGFRWISGNQQGASAELSYTAIWNRRQLEHALSLGVHLAW